MQKILVVVDMQKDFVDGALGTKEAQTIAPRVARKIRYHDGPIFVTYDTHFDAYMNSNEGSHLPVPHCIKGTEGWALDSRITDALEGKAYVPVEKVTFGSVDLPAMVEAAADDEAFDLELVGLCTDICVISNAMLVKAAFPEATVTVDGTCSAGVSEESHRTALQAMRAVQIEVVE